MERKRFPGNGCLDRRHRRRARHLEHGLRPVARPGLASARAAFTLLELLIVIGVLGLLVALLGPALAHARTASRDTVCATRLHDLGVLHFDQAWEADAWASSAYDLRGSRFEAVADRVDLGYRGAGGDNDPPGGASTFTRKLHDAEHAAPAQPPSWKTPCPEAVKAGEQSYGQNWRYRGAKPERFASIDLIFADSPYRLVARGQDLAPRHAGGEGFVSEAEGGRRKAARAAGLVNFMLGDGHVEAGDPARLEEDDLTRRLWRSDPIPAKYPD